MILRNFILSLTLILLSLTSCIPLKDLKYVQESDNLELNEYGLIPVKYEPYRVKKGDILAMTVISMDPEITKFFGNENTNTFKNSNDPNNRITGLNVDEDGEVYIYGLGSFKVDGLSLKQITQKVQQRVNEIYVEGKAEVRINMPTISYILMGQVTSPGEKYEQRNRISVLEAIAKAGDLTKVANRKEIIMIREYPEGKKFITMNLTDRTVMNSPYFYIQSGDLVIFNPRKEYIIGWGTGTVISDVMQAINMASQAVLWISFFKNIEKVW